VQERIVTWQGRRREFGGPRPRLRRFVFGALLLALAAALTGCLPNEQSVTRGEGDSNGTTLRLSVVDHVAALLGGSVLGGLSSGFDRIDGDLALVTPGTWRGTVTGKSERTIEVIVMDAHCKTELKGTQRLDAVATSGRFAEGRNLRIVLTPASAPNYSAYPTCNAPPVKETAPNGIEWLDFYLDAYQGSGMEVRLPDKPGGKWEWEFSPNPNPGYPGCGAAQVFAQCSHTTTLTVEYR
jgi:hypothetical protein